MARKLLRVLFLLMFFGSGVMHFLDPAFFEPLMPAALPAHRLLIYLSGAVEIVVAIGLFIPRVRWLASLGVLALLVVFTPLHIIDLFREQPMVGSQMAAIVRLVIQAGLLAGAAFLVRHDLRARQN